MDPGESCKPAGRDARALQLVLVIITALCLVIGGFLVVEMTSKPGYSHLTSPAIIESMQSSETKQVAAAVAASATTSASSAASASRSLSPANTLQVTAQSDFAIHEYSHVFNRHAPHGFLQWLQMALEHKCVTTVDAYAQIYNDLQPWFARGRIHRSDLELPVDRSAKRNSYSNGSGFMLGLQDLFQRADVKSFEYLQNGWDEPISLPATDDYKNEIWDKPGDMFEHNSCLRETYDAGDGSRFSQMHSFFMSPDTFVSVNRLVPMFSQAKARCYKDLLIPLDHHISITQKGHVNDPIPWDKKKNVLFWRGATSDGHHGDRYPLWRQAHRVRLVDWAMQFGKDHPERVFDAGVEDSSSVEGPLMVDVGFHAIIQCDVGGCKELQDRFGVKKSVTFEKTKEFKYLLVVDGNSWPNRLQSYLETNSVILYNGIFNDWFNGQLKPWIHYVPVRLDLADLDDALQWLHEHDDDARRISENARALMRGMNEFKQLRCFTGLMFLEYAELYEA
ncbi:glycosyl transferase family 90-domain-containing protein [Chytriomyces sp. MP71]|nr:glycosyl transferase family 90-domain-containing protein [Chytriomyces sp. MP71]